MHTTLPSDTGLAVKLRSMICPRSSGISEGQPCDSWERRMRADGSQQVDILGVNKVRRECKMNPRLENLHHINTQDVINSEGSRNNLLDDT